MKSSRRPFYSSARGWVGDVGASLRMASLRWLKVVGALEVRQE